MRWVLMTALAVLGSFAAPAQTPAWRHGASLLGDLKYPEGFKHYGYVNPNAPKSGRVRLAALGGYDSFNFVPIKGIPERNIGYLYQSLLSQSLDEPSSEYGEIADGVRYPEDYSSVTYRLNPRARWHDGRPITPEDVIWSFEALKAHNPQRAYYYQNVVKAEATGEREVTFTFDKAGNRELPQIVGQLTVLPRHWWTGTGPDGKPRDIAAASLEPPLGSGPYKIKRFEAGRSAVYERVKDWWGADLPTAAGHYNFDEITVEYYTDLDVMREAFKGGAYDFHVENTAKAWMTAYDVTPVKNGRIVRQEIPEKSLGRMQAFGFNLRREKFKDVRVRRAFNLVLDFEEMNKTLFYGLYTRIESYFSGLELASSGLPQGLELDILNSIKDKVPPEVFTRPYVSPINGTDEARRANLREALRLLKEAGWEIKNRKLVNVASGEEMTIEILLDGKVFERAALTYKQSLERLGVAVTIRLVDASQHELRERNRDFDLIVFSMGQSQSPGNEQRSYWGSAAADQPTSPNILGIKNPGVDALIDRVVFAKNREELVAATHALDRVLLAGYYVVPHWRSPTIRTLRWDRFSGPDILPSKSPTGGFPDVWWFDPVKAAKTDAK